MSAGATAAEERALARARAGDGDAFAELTAPYRRELQLHCYRMLGSVQDAEDLLQETLVAAWRGLRGFEGRASLRTWLHRIATNRCLNALRSRAPRRLSDEPWPAPGPPVPTRHTEPLWLEPLPDHLLEGVPDDAPGPEARYDLREGVALAFVTGLQRLPARQRAVLVLRDVLGYHAAEAAQMLDASVASVNSALQRARAALHGEVGAGARDRAPLPGSARERAVVDRFQDAQERGDVDALMALLTDDAWLTMPPEPLAYRGPAAIRGFLTTIPAGGRIERFRLLRTRANGQPALAGYLDDGSGVHRASVLDVLTLAGDRVAAMTAFTGPGLFARHGLPEAHPG